MIREIKIILTVIKVLILCTCLCSAKSISSSIIEQSIISADADVRILDGDILIPNDFGISGKDGITLEGSKWKDRTVPYTIANFGFTNREKKVILEGIKEINDKTCIRIVPRKQESDYVYVINGNGCYSYLGRVGGQQPLSLQHNGCLTGKGITMHEFLHAIGILHEHNRFDRDDYITVHWENIPPEWRSQYEKYPEAFYTGPTASLSNFGLAYDYDSVTHYPKKSPGSNKDAITVNDPSISVLLGQRTHLSDLDIKRVNAMYGC